MKYKKDNPLNAILKDMCISKVLFARKIGISPQRLQNYLNGKSMPPIAIAVTIEKFTEGKIKVEDWITPRDSILSNDISHRTAIGKT